MRVSPETRTVQKFTSFESYLVAKIAKRAAVVDLIVDASVNFLPPCARCHSSSLQYMH